MQTNPGSHEAKKIGCTCPVLDNAFGAGAIVNGQTDSRNFYIDPDCPIHQDMRGFNAESTRGGDSPRPAQTTEVDARDNSIDIASSSDQSRGQGGSDRENPSFGHGSGILESDRGETP